MSLLALVLVICSAITHIYWNAEVKHARQPEVFSLLLQVSGSVMAIAVALLLGDRFNFSWQGWACIVGTGLTYGAYYTLIAKSYERGDLSLAYPIIRGTAPVFTLLIALIITSKVPPLMGGLGIALICGGVLTGVVDAKDARISISLAGIMLAVATGICTAIYSTVDQIGAEIVHPLLYLGLAYIPGSIAQWIGLRSRKVSFDLHFKPAELVRLFLASCSNTFGYFLFLLALIISNAAYVVSARSVGVVLSLVVGAVFFKEPITPRRTLSACAILAGIVAITLA
jgi:drug/metabolite transporter (DMT)-like permease